MAKRRIPPAESLKKPIYGVEIEEIIVGNWCPTTDGSGPPEAVALQIKLRGLEPTLTLRLKSPDAVDTIIQALLRHKRQVWPDAS